MSINKVIVSGHLTRDPELRMAGATPVLQFGIAVNEKRKNAQSGEWDDIPNFFEVTVWGARGESLSRMLAKGAKVVIAGRLRWSQWQNTEGQTRTKVEIVAEDVDLMSQKGSTASQQSYAPVEVLGEDIPF